MYDHDEHKRQFQNITTPAADTPRADTAFDLASFVERRRLSEGSSHDDIYILCKGFDDFFQHVKQLSRSVAKPLLPEVVGFDDLDQMHEGISEILALFDEEKA